VRADRRSGARFYAPSAGVFTQLDTVAGSAQNPASMNRFLYAQGNPTSLVDPTGHSPCNSDACDENAAVAHRNTAEGKAALRRLQARERAEAAERTRKAAAIAAAKRLAAQVAAKARALAKALAAAKLKIEAKIAAAMATLRAKCSAAQLDCSLADIQGMSMSDREAWIRDFQSSHDTKDWLNAIQGVVAAADVNGLDQTSWFGTVDARILSNIQSGYIEATTGKSVDTAGGVAEWRTVWTSVQLGTAGDDEINRQVANAEAASINQGRSEARGAGKSPTFGEAVDLVLADGFRLVQRNRGVARDAASATCGLACEVAKQYLGVDPSHVAINTAVDERDYALAFAGASGGFAQNNTLAASFFPGWLFDRVYPQ
jgi:hypothetical protein